MHKGSLEEWHAAWGQGLLWQNDVSVYYSGMEALLGHPKAFRSMACPWPRGDAHCHNTQ